MVNTSEPVFQDIDFRTVDFPSDALSVKRFRALFPDIFDQPGSTLNGFGDFFFPSDTEEPEHLMQLTQLISEERTIASGAFHLVTPPASPEDVAWHAEAQECIDDARKNLEYLYQLFKLADSPETARLLIRQIEEAGEAQARQAKGRPR